MSRKQDTHKADKFCRDIISRYPNSLETADMFFSDRTIVTGECPDWCALPSSYTAWFIAQSNDKADIVNILNQKAVYYLTAALIWSRSKMIYRFDKELADTLAAQSLEGKIPFDILDYLPYQCVYIEREMSIGGHKTIGFFAWLDWGTKNNTKLLRLEFLRSDNYYLSLVVPVFGGTIKDSIFALVNNNREAGNKFTEDDVNNSPVAQSLIECVNLLLYLCSEKPDMPDVTELQTRRSRNNNGNPKRAATWEVGTRIGAALRKAAEKDKIKEHCENDTPTDESLENEKSRVAPRPHLRRAHWHSFWSGKRGSSERKLALRWLPPIAVNIDNTDLPTVISPVKREREGEK